MFYVVTSNIWLWSEDVFYAAFSDIVKHFSVKVTHFSDVYLYLW